MKISHTLRAMIAVLSVSWCSCFGQGAPQSPSVSSLTRFESYPVDYYTGMPNISLPLYTMPTRSKDISIGIGLSYHASSVSSIDENMGNCGRGWLLSGGGSISRSLVGIPDERILRNNMDPEGFSADIFQFNFLSFSGKFTLKKAGSLVVAKVSENKGEIVYVEVDYNPSTYEIRSFKFYDTKGYKYVFGYSSNFVQAFDSFINVYPNPDYEPNIPNNPIEPTLRETIKSAFHLVEIFDSNNNSLAAFYYDNYDTVEEYHESGEKNISKSLNSIYVPGYGSVEMHNYYSSGTLNKNNRYTGITVKDYGEKIIKNFDFTYSNYGVVNPLKQLLKVVESAPDSSSDEIQTYELQYAATFFTSQQVTEDAWGYYNNVGEWCNNHENVDTWDIKRGILEKIILPTGGVIYYEFEPNTFSYFYKRPLEYLYNSSANQWYTDEGFFYRLDQVNFPAPIGTQGNGAFNLHNYISSSAGIIGMMDTNPNTSTLLNTFNFSVSGSSKTVYFQIDAPTYLSEPTQPGGDPVPSYPGFKLTGPIPAVTFTTQLGDRYGNYENFCNGRKITLPVGNYTMTLTATNNLASGSFSTDILTPVPANELKKYWYGGGIRVKSISYFTADSQDIQTTTPARKIDFNYNLFNEPNRSSGSLMRWGMPSNSVYAVDCAPVAYKNVTVNDSQTGGRTEYIYYTPLDYKEGDLSPTSDIRIGKLQKSKVYNTAGSLLQETTYDYNWEEVEFIGSSGELSTSANLGWVPLLGKSNRYYTGQDFVETIENFTYHGNRSIKTHTQTSAIEGDNLKTTYTFNTSNAPTFFNRNEIETVENYRDGELISKSKTNYANTWTDPHSGTIVNTSYLPQTAQGAKGNNALETNVKFNKYDIYGHLLESETENGIKTAYIWGYNSTQLIAKIEGLGYDQIPAARIQLIQTAISNYSEGSVLSALMNLRNDAALSSALMTSYTYIPLVGVSTITDARGRTIRYEYDQLNRLTAVKDQEGNILTETKYHTKPQN